MNILSKFGGFFRDLDFGKKLIALKSISNVVSGRMMLPLIILTLVVANIAVFVVRPFEPDGVVEATEKEVAKMPGKIYSIARVKKKETALRGVPIISSRTATEEEYKAILAIANLHSSIGSRSKSNYSSEGVERLLIATARDVGFPETEIENVLRHAYCESGWNVDAKNRVRGGHHGIMQVQGNHWEEFGSKLGTQTRTEFVEAMHTVRANLQVAYWLWEKDKNRPAFKSIRDGWGPWKATYGCRNRPSRHGVPWENIITVYRYKESV